MNREPQTGSRFTLLIALLLSAAALLAAGLAFQTWRTASAHRDATRRVLQDYASFAAWSFGARVRNSTFFAINPIFGGADAVPKQVAPVLAGMRQAADSITRCECGIDLRPQVIFIIDLRDGRASTLVRDSSVAAATIAERTGDITNAARASIAKGVSSREPGAVPYRWVSGGRGDDAWVAFYGVLFRSETDPGTVFGFSTSAESFAGAVLAPAAEYGQLLPASLVRASPRDSLMSVEVTNGAMAELYRSHVVFASPFLATETLGSPDTALTATVTMNPSVAPSLVIGGLPPSPVRTVLPLVSLAIALLAVAFYLMRRQQIISLEVRARLSEAKLAALRGQLQPHFLFNVLNSIAMLARKGDNRAVVITLSQLGDLLRASLRESSSEFLPLADELNFIRKYLALEAIRYDTLAFTIDCPDNLGDAQVPMLILQPLVENALRHGVATRDSGGIISIVATKRGSTLTLEVTDNGPGISASMKQGIGIQNTHERLAEIYGGGASFDIGNGESGGAGAVIVIPLQRAAPVRN